MCTGAPARQAHPYVAGPTVPTVRGYGRMPHRRERHLRRHSLRRYHHHPHRRRGSYATGEPSVNGGRNLPAVITPCVHCNHAQHDMGVRCGAALTETVRDDVGYARAPTHLTRTLLVGTCGCTACGVWRGPTLTELTDAQHIAPQVTTLHDATGHHPDVK